MSALMSVEGWALLAVFWAICGVVAYGLTLGYFQREFVILGEKTRPGNVVLAVLMCLIGPMGLAVAFFSSGFGHHGFRWR